MIKVLTGSRKQITGFVWHLFSVVDLAAERQAAVTVLEKTISVLLFETHHKVTDVSEPNVTGFFSCAHDITIIYVYTLG